MLAVTRWNKICERSRTVCSKKQPFDLWRSMTSSRSREKNRGAADAEKGGGLWKKARGLCNQTRRALKKRRRALETDTAGFVMKLRRLWKQKLCRSCPKAYPSADVRVWFHRKLTCYPVCVYGFTKSLPVTFGVRSNRRRIHRVVSPKVYPSPGVVSCTASMFHSTSSTEFASTPDLFPSSFDVPERSANGASPNPDESGRSFL